MDDVMVLVMLPLLAPYSASVLFSDMKSSTVLKCIHENPASIHIGV